MNPEIGAFGFRPYAPTSAHPGQTSKLLPEQLTWDVLASHPVREVVSGVVTSVLNRDRLVCSHLGWRQAEGSAGSHPFTKPIRDVKGILQQVVLVGDSFAGRNGHQGPHF